MEVIVFGTGKIAHEAYSAIERRYKVLWYVDSDCYKWGEKIGDYDIRDPKSILNNNANVLVVSTLYRIDIANTLINMGVESNRIYLCNKEISEGKLFFDFFPYSCELLKSKEKQLVEYDLKEQNEKENAKMKLMIFASFYSVYTKQLIEKVLSKYDNIEVSLLTYARESAYMISAKNLKHIYMYNSMAELKSILEQIPKYDIAQMLWIEYEWAYFQKMIMNKFRKVNLCVGGSDFYRALDSDRDYKRDLIYNADCISAETEETILAFKKYYGENLYVKLLPFGVEVLSYIKKSLGTSKNFLKKKFGIPLNKYIVTCGHNAKSEHQHIELINNLAKLPNSIKKKSVFVFPMTYPSGMSLYIEKVKKELEKNELNYVVLTEFMDFQKMAEYAIISDIMIHVQTTDQLSSTMLEEMYAGSIVIAGAWLPYRSLHEKGMYFIDVNDIEDVTIVVKDVIDNFDEYREKCKVNKELVWNHSSWDVLCEKWYELWV